MSTSTIVLKTPSESQGDNIMYRSKSLMDHPHKSSSSLLLMSLWAFSAIFSVTKLDFTTNMNGISSAFNVQDALMICITAYGVHRGLTIRNFVLVIPWVAVNMYILYYNHYKGLVRMINILKHVRQVSVLPWLALFLFSVALIIRIVLTLRILQLTANLWYRKKLEKELYQTIH